MILNHVLSMFFALELALKAGCRASGLRAQGSGFRASRHPEPWQDFVAMS